MSEAVFELEVPKPLEGFRERADSSNIELINERLARFDPILSKKELKRIHRELERLRFDPDLWQALIDERDQLWQEYCQVKDDFLSGTEPKQKYRLSRQGVQIAVAGKRVMQRIGALQDKAERYQQLTTKLRAHDEAKRLEAEERENFEQFKREARHYEQLLEEVFRKTKRCHDAGYDRKGRWFCDIPHFQRIYVSEDTIDFLLLTSRKTMFGYRSCLPYNVDVVDLISEATVKNMEAVTGHQIQVEWSAANNRIYYKLNRLDGRDGLPIKVSYRRMIPHYPVDQHEVLPFPVGVGKHRRYIWKNFTDQPHLLIAGTTNTGKSTAINAIIATLTTMNKPEELRIVLIDNKGGAEFVHWEDVPHRLGPMIDRTEDVLPALERIRRLMQRRLGHLKATKTKNILEYNRVVPYADRMPRIVVFVDELATLMNLTTTGDIQNELAILTSQGRAAGVHMVLCTQHPSVDTIPGRIKTNMGCRIAFFMPTGSASMTVLDTQHAAALTALPGRIICAAGRVEEEAQSPLITQDEISLAVMRAREYGAAPDIAEFELLEASREAVVQAFGEFEAVDISLQHLEGKLSAARIHDYLGTESPGLHALRKVVDSIKRSGKIEHKGEMYELKPNRNSVQLIKVEQLNSADVPQGPDDADSVAVSDQAPVDSEETT